MKLLRQIISRLPGVRSVPRPDTIGFAGPFPSWPAAVQASRGYDDRLIAQGVVEAVREVEAGRAAMERDGFLLPTPEYPYPLIAAALRQANQNGGRLTVLDFGGSLGSSYRAVRPWLKGIPTVRWHIVEQPVFVETGNREFASDELVFHTQISDVPDLPDLVLVSGVLMYLENPHLHLSALLDLKADTVIIDRTATQSGEEDLLCVEHVQCPAYTASYPCWLLSLSRLQQTYAGRYDCSEMYRALDQVHATFTKVRFYGMLLMKHPL
jgi:putative methyltransferase (TIGR04325 family)